MTNTDFPDDEFSSCLEFLRGLQSFFRTGTIEVRILENSPK